MVNKFENENLEYWLAGPIPEIPDLLQPVAHALLQVKRELVAVLSDFQNEKLWEKPKGMASVGFHLQHLSGVLDRLFTYARNVALSESQLEFLKNEGLENVKLNIEILIDQFDFQLNIALDQLKITSENSLKETRLVGRKQIPSTVIGLLFHAAEHTTRHFGQLLVTAKFLK